MSHQAVTWALSRAPVDDRVTLLVLLGLAEHAQKDGTASRPSRRTLAGYARCSLATAARRLRELEESGLVRRGDQRLVEHLPRDRRPVVYDLDLTRVRADPVVNTLAPSGRRAGSHSPDTPLDGTGCQDFETPFNGTGSQDVQNGVSAVRDRTVTEPSLYPPTPQVPRVATGHGMGEGGVSTSKKSDAASRALEVVVGELPPGVTQCLTPGGLGRATVVVAELLELGWLASWLATDIKQGDWGKVADHDAVLLYRLRKQKEKRPPAQSRPRAALPVASTSPVEAAVGEQPVQVRAPSNLRALVDDSRAAARRPTTAVGAEPMPDPHGDEHAARDGLDQSDDEESDQATRSRQEVGA